MSATSIIAEPGTQEIVITRVFNAPRELVYETFLKAETVPDWWGPRSMKTIVDKMEVRKGGVWRYIQYDHENNEHAHTGVYHDCIYPERVVNTYEYEGVPGSVGLVTVTLEEQPGGKTRFTETTLYPSVAVRDMVVQSGMSEGAMELMDRLAEQLDKLQQQ